MKREETMNMIIPPAPPCAECEKQTTGYRAVDDDVILEPDKSGHAVMQVEATCPNGHVNIYTWAKRWVWRWDDKCSLTFRCNNRKEKLLDYCKSCNEILQMRIKIMSEDTP